MSEYYQAPDPRFSQGDIIELAPHTRLLDPVSYITRSSSGLTVGLGATEEVIAEARHQLAVILTPDCELDKKQTTFWLIAPIHPLAALLGQDQGNVRKNKVLKWLHLPAYGTSIPECFIDLATITTVKATVIQKAKRIATLSDSARAALYMQQTRWFSRWVMSDIDCPRCNLKFNPTDTMPVRSI